MKAGNKGETQQVFFLFIAVTTLKNFETLDSAVYMFNVNSVTPDLGIKPLLIIGKRAVFRLLIRSQTV